MTIRRAILAVFAVIAFSITAHAQSTEQEWRAKAVEKYPALGVQGSDFNKQFLDAYWTLRRTNPDFFTDPKWPITLANQLAASTPNPTMRLPTSPTGGAPSTPLVQSSTTSPAATTEEVETHGYLAIAGAFLCLVLFVGFVVFIVRRAFAAVTDTEAAGPTVPRAQIVCPHCQTRGHVTARKVLQKKGVSGGKATAALLTGGFSILLTGLSREEEVTEAVCANCGSTWRF